MFFRAPQFHNKFEPNSVTFNEDSQDELTNFLKKNRFVSLLFSCLNYRFWQFGNLTFPSHGLVGHRETGNVRDFEHPNVIVYYAVDFVNNAKQTNYWRNRILQVAKDNADYKFAISSGDDFRQELEKFGSPYLGEKPLVTANDKDQRKYKMTAEFSLVFFLHYSRSFHVNFIFENRRTFQGGKFEALRVGPKEWKTGTV